MNDRENLFQQPTRATRALALLSVCLGALLGAACASGDEGYARHDDNSRYAAADGRQYASHDQNGSNGERRFMRADYRGINGARRAHAQFSPGQAEALDGDCERYVKLLQGETLSDIAEYCDVSVSSIVSANPAILDARAVPAGTTLHIPDTRSDVYEGGRIYPHDAAASVRPPRAGDNWYGREGYSRDYYGDYARRASALRSAARGTYYVIRSGDTLSEIAQRYDVALADIAYLNPDLEPRRLGVGDRVYLPDYARTEPWSRQVNRVDYRDDWSVRPIVSIWPNRGAPGSEIQVNAEGLPPNTDVVIYAGETEDSLEPRGTARTDAYGRVSTTIRLPRDYGGSRAMFGLKQGATNRFDMSEYYSIDGVRPNRMSSTHDSVNGGSNTLDRGTSYRPPRAKRTYYDARISVPQRSIAPNQAAHILAQGFPPYADISIYAGPTVDNGQLVARTRTDADGLFDINARIPDNSRDDTSVVFVAVVDDSGQKTASDSIPIDSRGANDSNAPGFESRLGRGSSNNSSSNGDFDTSLGDPSGPHDDNRH